MWSGAHRAPLQLIPFKELHGFLVFLRGRFCLECAEVSALARLGILLARIQPITTLNFSDHDLADGRPTQILPLRVSTRNVFRATLAGPCVTLPVRTSKRELCHGHCTLNPS